MISAFFSDLIWTCRKGQSLLPWAACYLKGTYGVQFFENVIWGKLWIRFSIIFLSQFQPFPLRTEKFPVMQGTKGGHSKISSCPRWNWGVFILGMPRFEGITWCRAWDFFHFFFFLRYLVGIMGMIDKLKCSLDLGISLLKAPCSLPRRFSWKRCPPDALENFCWCFRVV